MLYDFFFIFGCYVIQVYFKGWLHFLNLGFNLATNLVCCYCI